MKKPFLTEFYANPDKHVPSKTCRTCGITKPLSEFHKCRNNRRNTCAECRRSGKPKYSSAATQLQRKLNIQTPKLGTSCPICGSFGTRLVFDHCHDTNTFRGFICKNCNSVLGHAGDNINSLVNYISYLIESEEQLNSVLDKIKTRTGEIDYNSYRKHTTNSNLSTIF